MVISGTAWADASLTIQNPGFEEPYSTDYPGYGVPTSWTSSNSGNTGVNNTGK